MLPFTYPNARNTQFRIACHRQRRSETGEHLVAKLDSSDLDLYSHVSKLTQLSRRKNDINRCPPSGD